MAPWTILIVEDDPLSRELVVDLLAVEGYRVLQAEDGRGLLARVKAERPALILLDLQLPGVDGFTLARRLKADPETRAIPVLAVTAYARPEERTRALQAGCDGYLPKPFAPKGLLQAVAHFLGRSGGAVAQPGGAPPEEPEGTRSQPHGVESKHQPDRVEGLAGEAAPDAQRLRGRDTLPAPGPPAEGGGGAPASGVEAPDPAAKASTPEAPGTAGPGGASA